MRAYILIPILILTVICIFIGMSKASSYDGKDIALAILHDPSTLISSYYEDSDPTNQFRQRAILNSLGILSPTDGDTFVILSTGIAGATPVTTDSLDPGSERGTWFGPSHPGPGDPFDKATLVLNLRVPEGMHNVSIDLQFFSTEYPDYVGSIYNDKVNITLISPSKGAKYYQFDVNSGDFVLESRDIPGTGFDVFAVTWSSSQNKWVPTYPSGVDTVTTTPYWSDDAGASALITRVFPVSPNENITIKIEIQDAGDNQFDSAVFIDNIRFCGYGFPEVKGVKTWQDLNGGTLQPGDRIRYIITISNIGNITLPDNPGYEFEDPIPENTTFVPGSLSCSSGTCSYLAKENKVVWNGSIPAESSVMIAYSIDVYPNLTELSIISNQGIINWDRDEDGINEAQELTDDPAVDDGIDKDGDGETWDDDPTISVVLIENLTELRENFSDDTPNQKAIERFHGLKWFETTFSNHKGYFGVAGSYFYFTPKSFKIQLRNCTGTQYWNYSFNQFLSRLNVSLWEIYFACGNNSEPSNLFITFLNKSGKEILKMKIDYEYTVNNIPDKFSPCLYYLDRNGKWIKISSDHSNGYLYNGWYRLRIETNGTKIDYSLYRSGHLTDRKSDFPLNATLSELSKIAWLSTLDSDVCPIVFVDEHLVAFS